MDWTERGTIALLVGYLATLAAVLVIDEPIVWLAWAAATVVAVGAALVAYNR